MKSGSSLPGEFELIARYFAPLAEGFAGAYGLQDDAAVVTLNPGQLTATS
jgi:thiamine-monophosphate kinase